ncbi:MAG: flavin reductase family protein [Actinomycetota bacterium]|nr:flavin reductase family protein [Actinomycetota bacterium]
MPVADSLFLEIMSSFPTGVTVVTTTSPAGMPKGLTVSAFCPVSLHPPMVLVCLDNQSSTLAAIVTTGRFTVNFLAAGREKLARRFATKMEDKFEGVQWQLPVSGGGPILSEDSGAHVVCRLERTVEAGDHQVLLGHVEDGGLREDHLPLLYGRRRYTDWAGAG